MQPVIARYQADQRRHEPGRGRRAAGAAPHPRRSARMAKFHADWADALGKIDFDALSVAGRVDYVLLKTHIGREHAPASNSSRRPARGARTTGPRAGRAAATPSRAGPSAATPCSRELAGEMIPYTPEELIAIAEREFAWCEAEMKKAVARDGLRRRLAEGRSRRSRRCTSEPGEQPELIRELAVEAIDYLDASTTSSPSRRSPRRPGGWR